MSVVDPHEYDPKVQNMNIYKSLLYLAEIFRSSGEIDKSLECLNKCVGLTDQEEHLVKMSEIFLDKGMKPELLQTTIVLINKKPEDKYVRSLHNLACMLNNIQSVV